MIKRIQVEEGFLDGLDLVFSRGLNVLIGPRGSGKTSVIELIRFCLDVPGYTERSRAAEREHALSVLGPGRVTVTLAENGQSIVVSRTASEERPRANGRFALPVVLSQNEIEVVGLQSAGRLRLIDGFLASPEGGSSSREESLLAHIRSLTSQLQGLSQEFSDIDSQLGQLGPVTEQLRLAQEAETNVAASAAATKTNQAKLNELATAITVAAVTTETLRRASQALQQFKQRVESLLSPNPQLPPWPSGAGSIDVLGDARRYLAEAIRQIRGAVTSIDQGSQVVRDRESTSNEQRLKLEEDARVLRRQLEQIQQGAGAVSRRVAELKEKAGQLAALSELRGSKESEIEAIRYQRGELLDELDTLRGSRYQQRLNAATQLTATLGPAIEVRVTRAAFHAEYVRAITSSLRGSGLHYNALAPDVAERLSPRELVEAVESGDVDVLLNVAGLNSERASRVIAHLRGQSLGDIVTSRIEDAVDLELLVGTEYRPTEELSTGQRCTVVLPILLAREDVDLVVDQPEDHLDNAFIVNTVIQAVSARKESGQMIFATHNPNVPVLGEAELVVLLGSDGKRGFVVHSGPLEEPKSVEAITSVMEGGRQAFLRRAAFYGQFRG